MRYTGVLIGGIAVGMLIAAGAAISSDDKSRRKIMRGSKRAFRKAGHMIEDMF